MLLCDDINHFELRIMGYEYPGISDDEYDANWLIIAGHVRTQEGEWRFRDPCLLTWEVSTLIEFLDELAKSIVPEGHIAFIEPNLSFVSPCPGTFQVYFQLEASPPWRHSGFVGEDEVFVEFNCTPDDLRTAAQSLRNQLAQFPGRAGRTVPGRAV